MLASWLGQKLGLGPHRVKILLGCGAAAGLAATYNVPVGGALFAMEVILGNFALEIFGPIVAASVIATVIARAVLGDVPLYAAAGYELQNGWELIPYLGLGVLGAFASVAFVFGVRGGRELFDRDSFLRRGCAGGGPLPRRRIAVWFRTARQRLRGHTQALSGQLPLLCCCCCRWRRSSPPASPPQRRRRRDVHPALFVGAMVGGWLRVFVHTLWPFATRPMAPNAAVGMAAIAPPPATRPISAILILFELTGNYHSSCR